MTFILTFIGLSIINVIFSTARSIVTIKGGKLAASLMSGGYFAFYNVMLIFTVADFPMWQKCIITFITNVIGVWIVKVIEDKMRKDKLWLVKVTIPNENVEHLKKSLSIMNIPNTQLQTNTNYVVFDCYCQSKEDTRFITDLCVKYKGKAFASENKL